MWLRSPSLAASRIGPMYSSTISAVIGPQAEGLPRLRIGRLLSQNQTWSLSREAIN